MHTNQILAIFSLFTSMALAAPAPAVEVADVSARDAGDLAKRYASFNMYGGDNCRDQVHGYFHADGTGFRCYPVPAGKRSIHNVGRYVSLRLHLYCHPNTSLVPLEEEYG
jgi:hypothetical protein